MSSRTIARKPSSGGKSPADAQDRMQKCELAGVASPKETETLVVLDATSLERLREVTGVITVVSEDMKKNRTKKEVTDPESGPKDFICSHCAYSARTKSALYDHVRKTHTHPGTFSCTYCHYTCDYDLKLRRHLEIHHLAENPFPCDHCDERFPRYFMLKEHKAEVENAHVCNTCQYRCSNEQRLEDHMKTHKEPKTLQCDHCEFSCDNKPELRRHTVSQHGLTPYGCQYCNFKSSYRSALKAHLLTHTGEKPYACTFCDHRCRASYEMKSHIMIAHTNTRPYVCDICDYKTARKNHLKLHKMTHSQDKPHACSYCPFRSNFSWRLNEHMRIHTGEKPYACDYCDYRAARKDYLDSHMRQHSDVPTKPRKSKPRQQSAGTPTQPRVRAPRQERFYTCEICDCRVSRMADLQAHMKRHVSKRPAATRTVSGNTEDYLSALSSEDSDDTDDHSYDQFEDVRVMSDSEADALDVLAEAARAAENYEPPPNVARAEERSGPALKHPNVIVVGTEGGVITGFVPEPTILLAGEKPKDRIKVHAGEKPFICDVCGYSTANKAHFKVHELIHTGEKRFECEYCHYKTVTNAKLMVHKRGHTGEKPYACSCCEYKASRKDYLNAHMRQHIGNPTKPRPRKQRQQSTVKSAQSMSFDL